MRRLVAGLLFVAAVAGSGCGDDERSGPSPGLEPAREKFLAGCQENGNPLSYCRCIYNLAPADADEGPDPRVVRTAVTCARASALASVAEAEPLDTPTVRTRAEVVRAVDLICRDEEARTDRHEEPDDTGGMDPGSATLYFARIEAERTRTLQYLAAIRAPAAARAFVRRYSAALAAARAELSAMVRAAAASDDVTIVEHAERLTAANGAAHRVARRYGSVRDC